MPDPNPTDLVADPLSDISRKERRNLLIASTIGFAVAKMGLIPEHVSALGVEFSAPAQNSFVVLVTFTVLYFVAAFTVYGVADFLVWRKKYYDYVVAAAIEFRDWTPEDQHNYDELHTNIARIDWLYHWSKPASFVRIFFEFVAPLLVGIFVMCLLVLKASL